YEPINWHRTALHELGHWTGAAQRLDRDLSGSFGSKKYAQEELVAEITSAFVCASLGIVPTVCHADYIGSWLEVVREDDRAIVRAASAASKAADYLLAFRPESNEPVEAVELSGHLVVSDRQEVSARGGSEKPTTGAAVLGSRAAVIAVTGHQQRNRSVAPVAEIRRCPCPTIRLYETTTTTISAAFFAAKALRFSWTKASFSPHTMR